MVGGKPMLGIDVKRIIKGFRSKYPQYPLYTYDIKLIETVNVNNGIIRMRGVITTNNEDSSVVAKKLLYTKNKRGGWSIMFDDDGYQFTLNTWAGKKAVICGDSIACGKSANYDRVEHPFLEIACRMNGITNIENRAVSMSKFKDVYNNQTDNLEADLILVSCGTNDWRYDTDLGEFGDNSLSTFYGAVYLTLNKIRTNNPNAKTICCLPLPRGTGTPIEIDERTNGTGKTMQDYREGIKKICDTLAIEYITQNELFIHPSYTPNVFYPDKLHPIQIGHDIMGKRVGMKICNLTPM